VKLFIILVAIVGGEQQFQLNRKVCGLKKACKREGMLESVPNPVNAVLYNFKTSEKHKNTKTQKHIKESPYISSGGP